MNRSCFNTVELCIEIFNIVNCPAYTSVSMNTWFLHTPANTGHYQF